MSDNKVLNQLLQRIAFEEKFEQPDIQIKPISTGGANFSSTLYLVTISTKQQRKFCWQSKNKTVLNLFAKVAAVGEAFREGNSAFKIYDIEMLVYTNLFQTFRHLEAKHGIFEEHKLVLPKYYGSDSTYLQETIVLEDLSSKGYASHSRFDSVDWSYAKAAVTELAKFHALSFAFKCESPAEFDKMLKKVEITNVPENEGTKASFDKVALLALNAVHESNKGKLKKLLDGESMSSFYKNISALKHTILVHGDFRPSNMLYRKIENGATKVIPVDYQTVQGGCPVSDLVYFLVISTDQAFRARYYQQLVDHYYSELGAALARFGLDVNNTYPKEDFEFELKQKLVTGLVVAVMLLPLITAPEQHAPKVEGFTLDDGVSVPTEDLYHTRLNGLVDDFVAWGVLTD